MRYLKTYDNNINKPIPKYNIGDKVMCKIKYDDSYDLIYNKYVDNANEYLKENVGEVIDIKIRKDTSMSNNFFIIYIIKFLKPPDEIPPIWYKYFHAKTNDTYYTLHILEDEILTNKENEIEALLNANKYNL